MSLRIGVVDYGRGNLRSVSKALEAVGANTCILSSPTEMPECDAIVLPGVGAFGDCASSLERLGFTAPLRQWLENGRPFLGICLGYQILFEGSEESPDAPGLGVFRDRVRRFSSQPGLKIPHMGWNSISFAKENPLFQSLPQNSFVYFVHSYYPDPEDRSIVSVWCDYGEKFAAGVSVGNIHAVQFHPEKSQDVGLQMLRNFLALTADSTR